jgi:hypothetical protein
MRSAEGIRLDDGQLLAVIWGGNQLTRHCDSSDTKMPDHFSELSTGTEPIKQNKCKTSYI